MEALMARGQSGRVVVEIDPEMKRRLYAELARSGTTLKDWLIGEARRYLAEQQQPTLFVAEASENSYRTREGT
jgi:hypothetical protein